MIKPMSKKDFDKALSKIPSNKAPDIFFNSVENYRYANERVKEAIRTVCNEMLSDMKKYSVSDSLYVNIILPIQWER